MKSSKERIAPLESEQRTKSKFVNETLNDPMSINEQYEELLSRLVELQKQNAILTQNMSQLKVLQNRVSKQEQVIKKQKQIISAKDIYYQSKINDLSNEVESHKKTCKSLQTKVNELENENSAFKNENSKLKSELSSTQSIINSKRKSQIIDDQKSATHKSEMGFDYFHNINQKPLSQYTESPNYQNSSLQILERNTINPNRTNQTKTQIRQTNILSPIRPKAKEKNKSYKSISCDDSDKEMKNKGLSLDKIIKMHNKLWKEETESVESIFY